MGPDHWLGRLQLNIDIAKNRLTVELQDGKQRT
jgi:hypothetical protein